MHLRMPSIDHGVASFLWALVLAVIIWLGLLAVGVSEATAVVLALLSFGAIFLYVRIYGEEEPPRRRPGDAATRASGSDRNPSEPTGRRAGADAATRADQPSSRGRIR